MRVMGRQNLLKREEKCFGKEMPARLSRSVMCWSVCVKGFLFEICVEKYRVLVCTMGVIYNKECD